MCRVPGPVTRAATTALLLLLAACAGVRHDWREVSLPGCTYEDAWTSLREVAERNGFAEDRLHTDRGLGQFQSRWKTRELPFGQGHRTRVVAEIERSPQPGWRLRFAVEKQRVRDFAKALAPDEGDWSHAGQDTLAEDVMSAQILMRLKISVTPGPARSGPSQG